MKLLFVNLCLCVLLQVGETSSAEPLPVFVSILPQKTFVERIGGALVDVSVMVQPGANPHNYEPRPGQMKALSKAKVYFAVGIGFEDVWLNRFASANPAMKIVHTEQGIKKIPMAAHHHGEERGDKSSRKHEQDGTPDPHVWLSPPNVKIIAKNIADSLSQADPEHRADYEMNLKKFQSEIDELDAYLRSIFADKKGSKFMVFHPAWGYFADAYGLEQIPVEIEGKEPKPAKLKELIEHAREDGIKIIFVQPQFSTKSAEAIAKAIGGEVAVADDLHQDWANNLRAQAEKFRKAMR
ncbi:MAG: cation ABC transporter substrate-binding protein [Desulfobacteraceae bacterium]|nr:MAG: cation ABC transporter substrate-binding protein [Desulfobacteraceae bacterium]